MRRSAHAASGLEPSVCWAMTALPLAMLLLLFGCEQLDAEMEAEAEGLWMFE